MNLNNHSLQEIPHYVDGSEYHGTGSKHLPVFNPATGQQTSFIKAATTAETQQAVHKAQQAFKHWSQWPVAKRQQLFFNYLRLLEQDIDNFAKIVSQEHGKTLDDAKGSIGRGFEVLEFCCGISTHLKSNYSSNAAPNIDIFDIRQPLGVCVGITPFNFPEMVPMWMYPVAIACGNSFILKPSEKDPSAAIYQAKKLKEAGFPDGVFNVLLGEKDLVNDLLENDLVKAVSFVGSTPVGKYIYEKATANAKRVQALCGAKNHLLLLPDANLDGAVDAILGSAYGAAGQRCMAISVVVAVGDELADKLIAKLRPVVANLNIGPYFQEGVQMGPLITKDSLDRVKNLIASGQKAGADLVVDGRSCKVKNYEQGFFLGGCLFDHVTVDMDIYRQEIFGPVLCVVRADSYEQALQIINDNEYGNGVAIFTANGHLARHFANNVEVGMVGINVPIPVPMSFYSFGGWKKSIFGSNAIYGPEGVKFYTKLKTVTSRWGADSRTLAQFNFQRGSDQ